MRVEPDPGVPVGFESPLGGRPPGGLGL